MNYKNMKTYLLFGLLAVTLTATSGCGPTWKNIPLAPQYSSTDMISLKIGVDLDSSEASKYYGPRVIGLLQEMKVFEDIVYPYRKGDVVDGVLLLSLNGGWDTKTGENLSRAVVSGLTLGLLTDDHINVEGTHEVDAILKTADVEVVRYSVLVNTKAEWGSGANATEIGNELDNLQSKKIAVDLANLINKDRLLIVDGVTKANAHVIKQNTPAQTTGKIQTTEGNQSISKRLQELSDLHKAGILSDEDYNNAKNRFSEIQKINELYQSGILSDEEYKKAKSRILEKHK